MPTFWLLLFVGFLLLSYSPTDSRGYLTDAAVVWCTIVFIVIIMTLVISHLWFGNATARSPGKRAAGLKIVRFDTGEPVGVTAGLVRTLAQLVTIATFGVPYAIVLFDRRGRTLHDRIAGTLVVER